MNERSNSIVFDDQVCSLINSSLEQMKISASDVQVEGRRNIDPMTTAAFLLKSRAVRLGQLRGGHPDIDDISWHILLDLMVSMNTGKSVTAHDLAVTHNVALSITTRYVEYLIGVGLVDKKTDARDAEPVALKLTASGDALTSKALRKISRELANF